MTQVNLSDPLKLQCGWCGRILREGKMPLSTGICRACADDVLKQLEAGDERPTKPCRKH